MKQCAGKVAPQNKEVLDSAVETCAPKKGAGRTEHELAFYTLALYFVIHNPYLLKDDNIPFNSICEPSSNGGFFFARRCFLYCLPRY